ncbi:hypothetical protein KFL_000060270 [Klebsormidium nitens]|uniref:Uncharacterized protein n=1 Tax=Klebsormidium nitens TaxID=105231 RepID=A0A0U9HI13_KLENI|nr:hypothetical protein KFL_000060270 [Klebsormidium nitens]|eukprot:GAQ77962.1 hypothetical protein KFL_000060270 [Klebsormidium nitens]
MASAVHMAASSVSSRVFSSASASCSGSLDRNDLRNVRAANRCAQSTFVGNLAPLKSVHSRNHKQQAHAVARPVVATSSGGGRRDGDQTSKQVLDAFFLGRALAETINERLGTALGELISEVSRVQAEQREFIREFQEEVQNRAEAELSRAAKSVVWEPPTRSSTSSTSETSGNKTYEPPPSRISVTAAITENPAKPGSTSSGLDTSDPSPPSV